MANPYDLAHELAKALRESQQFQEYLELKQKIDANEATAKMLEDLRSKEMSIQSKQMMGEQVSEEELDELRKLYQIVSFHSDIQAFLDAEYRLSVLLADIQKIIGEAISV